jgi:orotidine-5'-phosphate decarboxylase
MSRPFGVRLEAVITQRGALCVGIDPHPNLLSTWGLPHSISGLSRFADICVQAFGDLAAVVKPQSAFFEAYGSAGIAVLERSIVALRAAGALVILDVKRGDIGSTMDAYAAAYLSTTSPLAVDAITVSPYLGVGSLAPAFDLALANGNGVFVLALTSNPEGPQVQHALRPDGRSVAQTIIDELGERNGSAKPFGSLGVVVGATISPDVEINLSTVNGPFLVPGIGAQGGTAVDVQRIFKGALSAVLPAVSREVLRAGPDVSAVRAAIASQIDAFAFLNR